MIYGPSTVSLARKFFFELGGRPSVRHQQPIFDLRAANSNFGLSLSPDFNFSGRHNGLAIYFSRLVDAFWKSDILVNKNKKLELSLDSLSLSTHQKSIQSLLDFLNSTPKFCALPTFADTSRGGVIQAVRDNETAILVP